MTTTISPYDYCKHPEDYINSPGLDNVTRAYWDQYCAVLNSAGGPPISNSSNGWEKFKKFADDLGNATEQTLQQFVIGILTLPIQNIPFTNVPMYESVIPGIVGTKLLKPTGNLLKAIAKKGISKTTEEAGIEMANKGIDRMTINMVSMADVTAEVIAEDMGAKVAEDATFSAGKYSIDLLMRGMAETIGKGLVDMGEIMTEMIEATDPVMDIMLVLQITGMIFDGLDPCDLNLQLDADQLTTFTNSFNDSYRRTVMSSVESSQDSYGHITYNALWPLPYYAEQSAILPFKQDYYKKIQTKLTMQYLATLTHNSDGYPIYRPSGGNLVKNKVISGIALQELGFFSNNNTVVENWISKWWPILAGIFILIIVLMIVINVKKG